MGSSGVADPVANTQITVDWAISLIDALDVAYDDIDTLETDLAALEAIVAGIVTEGDYSTYTTKSTIAADSTTYVIREEQSWLGDDSKFLYLDGGGYLIIIDPVAGTLTNTGVRGTYGGNNLHTGKSVYGKYFVVYDFTAAIWLKIYKDGALLQTISTDDDANDTFAYPSFSPTGKYIVVQYYDGSAAAANRYKIRVYEGS